MRNIKFALVSVIFLAPFISYAAPLSCQVGDKFDMYTGKACVQSSDPKDVLVESLKSQIQQLQAEIAILKGNLGISITPEKPIGDVKIKEEEKSNRMICDAQVQQIINEINTKINPRTQAIGAISNGNSIANNVTALSLIGKRYPFVQQLILDMQVVQATCY